MLFPRSDYSIVSRIKSKIEGLGLHSFFVGTLRSAAVDQIFEGDPVPYSHLIRAGSVPNKYAYVFSEFYGLTVIGSIVEEARIEKAITRVRSTIEDSHE